MRLVRISDYGKLSGKKDDLLLLLNKLGVQTELTDFKYWNRNPAVDVLNETEDKLKKKVKNCEIPLPSSQADNHTAAPLPHATCSEDCIAW